jgi:exodeoxyribonuclease-5
MTTVSTTALTEEQEAAYDEVYDRLARGERYTGLRGYAGTGKTYLVGRLVEQLLEEDCTVTVCAPTHKAVQVLSDELGDAPVEMQTLHSFLGLRLEPTADGEYELVADEGCDFNEGVVIVDEASMIGREEWAHIEDSSGFVQWLFVGDPAQLPPVNEDPSPALDVPGPTLETIHRQAADNPILELATQIRTGQSGRFGSTFEDGKGVAITHDHEEFRDSVLRAFDSEAFAEDATHARVLAYRNKTVRRYNREIRAARYGADADRFVEGEWLVATETWFHEGVPRLTNSQEVRVKTATVDTFEADDQSEWTVWKLKVRTPGRGLTRTAYVLHEDEFGRYENALERRREAAQEDGSKWDRFFELRERFARVDYAYASTVHKCLPTDAQIETEHGPRSIGEIAEGDLVWTGQNRLRPVTDVFRTGEQRITRVKTASGTTLESSPEHRFLTQRGWVEAQSLRQSDTIAFARPSPGEGIEKENEEAYLMGYLVGDGTYSYDSNRVDVALSKQSPLHDWIRSLLAKHGPVGENPKPAPSQSTTLWVEDKAFRQHLRKRGLFRVTGHDKTCPQLNSIGERRSFLRGLFDADGSASAGRGMVRLVNTSRAVIRRVKAMLLRFGVASYVRRVQTPAQAEEAWVLHISGPSLPLFQRHISFRHPKKKARLRRTVQKVEGKTNRDFVPYQEEIEREVRSVLPAYAYGDETRVSWNGDTEARRALLGERKNLTWKHLRTLRNHLRRRDLSVPTLMNRLLEKKHFYDSVESVEVADETCEMVDIEVADDHSYIYRGAVVHNSQGSTFDTVFVDRRDLQACRDPDERRALLYVAVTRPARRLALLV